MRHVFSLPVSVAAHILAIVSDAKLERNRKRKITEYGLIFSDFA